MLPVWTVHYLPTIDGPSHLYNASLLLRLAAHMHGPWNDIYIIDWRPHPNWLGHLLLAALLTMFSASVAQKILLSGIIVLFLAGAWRLAGLRGEESRIYAFLALPLTFQQSLQFGYYNFCLAMGLYPLIVALWWERRHDSGWRTIRIIGGLLLLSYSAHPMPTLLAIGSIGVLWLVSSRDPRHLLALLPASAMLSWYWRTQPYSGGRQTVRYLIDYLTHTRFLMTFDKRQLTFGIAVFILYLVLAIVTLAARPRGDRAFGLLLLALLIVYFLAPSAAVGGLGINDRIAPFLFLVAIAWFTPNLPQRGRTALIGILAAAAIANAIFVVQRYRAADRVLREVVGTLDGASQNSTFIPLLFEARAPRSYYDVLTHAADYAAVKRNLVDLTNYEAELGYFPVRYKPGYPIVYSGIDPRRFDAKQYAERAEWVFVWKMPPNTETERNLNGRYQLARAWGAGRLYQRR